LSFTFHRSCKYHIIFPFLPLLPVLSSAAAKDALQTGYGNYGASPFLSLPGNLSNPCIFDQLFQRHITLAAADFNSAVPGYPLTPDFVELSGDAART
jgi:hypothetical protein